MRLKSARIMIKNVDDRSIVLEKISKIILGFGLTNFSW